MVVVSVVDVPLKGEVVTNSPITLSPFMAGADPRLFFGVPSINGSNPITPLIPSETPDILEDYFVEDVPDIFGGHFDDNSTLQYEPSFTPFALQIGTLILTNYSAFLDGNDETNGIETTVQQLPYVTDAPFRVDLLILPLCLAFGFAGMAFSSAVTL